jgi:hypothetical protein
MTFKQYKFLGIAIFGYVASMSAAFAVPPVTGDPVIVKYVGSIDWPQETPVTVPFLTQGDANAINDLHGDVKCDINISTPGNYHMALRDAMYGRPDLGHTGLVEQIKTLNGATICWTTSPPINEEQIPVENVQFKNVNLRGLPALAMGPGGKMNNLVNKGYVDPLTRQPFLRNRGNVMLVRADRTDRVKDVCSLANPSVRLVTPNPPGSTASEGGSFGNFSRTVFNIMDQNDDLACNENATEIFESIFGQDISKINTEDLNNTFNHNKIAKVYKSSGVRWVASSRIMHRDQPYALCNDYADVGVIFYHQAVYLKETMAPLGCDLEIVPFHPQGIAPETTLSGMPVGTLHIAKVAGSFDQKTLDGRDLIYNFLTTSPVWTQIMADHGMDDPTP